MQTPSECVSPKASRSCNAVDQIDSTVLRRKSYRVEALGNNCILTGKTILTYSCQIIHLEL